MKERWGLCRADRLTVRQRCQTARKGDVRAGNARVRRDVQLAWRWTGFQKDSQLTQWYTAGQKVPAGDIRKTMIVALARKLLVVAVALCDDR